MKTRHLTNRIIIIFFCLMSFTSQAAEILLKVDRTQIEFNETFKLSFKADEVPDGDPDFSPLDEDFKIINQSTSSNVIIVNGKYSRSKTWTLSLTARKKGTVTIPAINFGKDVSQSYQIIIKEPRQSTEEPGKSSEPLISELKISTDSAYPQQQIVITRRLLISNNISAYEFAPLNIKGVDFIEEDLGDVKQYQTKYGDTNYIVLEKNIAIYPQSAGSLLIEPSVAGARVAIQGSQKNDAYDPFRSNYRTIRRSSKEKSITVNPIPEAFNGKHWLVAKEVQLVEEFPTGDTFKIGEPITRTLLLIADGQNSSQLPEFETTPIKGLKQYPDQPLLKNNTSGTGVTGVQQIKVAIIPSAASTYTLPTISIPWWNTTTNTMDVARINARTFSVKPEAGSINSLDSKNISPALVNQIESINAGNNNQAVPQVSTNSSLPWKISTLLLSISLLVTLQILWKRKDAPTAVKKPSSQKTPSVKAALKDIKQACMNNDAQMSKDALIRWGQALFIDDSLHSLGDLSKKVDGKLSQNIQALNAYLYRNNNENWICNHLFDLCDKYTEKEKSQSKSHITNDKLVDLYK